MTKELPYFKFYTSKWNLGEIQFRTLEEQGLFINICSLLWERDGKLTEKYLLARYTSMRSNATVSDCIKSLCDAELIVLRDGEIEVSFLNEQLLELQEISNQNRENAFKRWAKLKKDHATECQLEENRIEEKEIKKRILRF